MRAFIVSRPGELRRIERDVPEPGAGQVLVRISCCGVCRTDLHLLDGDLPPRHPGVTPGHEVVGRVEARGPGAERFAIGARVGVAWLGATDGSCRFCRRGAENLCLAPAFTGWDRDGGYADFCVAEEAYAYALPEAIGDEQVAPLLCAGIIGYRASDLCRGAGGRIARHLRLWGQRPPGRPGGGCAGPPGACADPRGGQPAAGSGAGRGVGGGSGRAAAGAVGRRDPLCPGGEPGAGGAAGAGPRRNPGRGRDLALRYPGAELSAT